MVAARGDKTEPVPLEKVAGKRKTVPFDHPMDHQRPTGGDDAWAIELRQGFGDKGRKRETFWHVKL
jgi:hypothetical protein